MHILRAISTLRCLVVFVSEENDGFVKVVTCRDQLGGRIFVEGGSICVHLFVDA